MFGDNFKQVVNGVTLENGVLNFELKGHIVSFQGA